MYVTSVHIQNFCRIEDLALELRPGPNVLAGVNGVGKIAVLDAIAMLNFCPN
jgi:recombinational DNA repair ATPase RecF